MSDTASVAVETRSWPRRHRRWLVLAAVGLVAATGVIAALSWHFSSAVLVPDRSDWPADITVEELSPGRIVLSRSEDTLRPGVYGLDWQAGHAIVGDVIGTDADGVTRRLRAVRGYLAPGMKVALDPEVYAGDPGQALGLPFAAVRVPDELGPMPAWMIPGRTRTWAIVVHGINADPQVGLRMAPALHRAGLSSLLITYREDLGAPPSPDGLHHMGLTEWRDLQAAARYALSHGARHLVLVGYSMGGAIVSQFMEHSPLAEPRDDQSKADIQLRLIEQLAVAFLPGVGGLAHNRDSTSTGQLTLLAMKQRSCARRCSDSTRSLSSSPSKATRGRNTTRVKRVPSIAPSGSSSYDVTLPRDLA